MIVVAFASCCFFQKFFEPLYSFEVILVLSLGQFVDIKLSSATYLLQSLLKDLQVAYKFILKFGLPVHLVHRHHMPMVGINELAVDRT